MYVVSKIKGGFTLPYCFIISFFWVCDNLARTLKKTASKAISVLKPWVYFVATHEIYNNMFH